MYERTMSRLFMGPNGIMAARSNGGVTLSSNPPTYTARFEERIEGSEAAVAEAIMKFDYCRFFEDSIAIDIVSSIGTGSTEVGVKDIKEWGNCGLLVLASFSLFECNTIGRMDFCVGELPV